MKQIIICFVAFVLLAGLGTQYVFGYTIAALPLEQNISNGTIISYNNSAYRTPTLSEIETFKSEKASNEDLISQYAEHINCRPDNLCSLVFAGLGILKLEFSDGHEDSIREDFIGLDTVREALNATMLIEEEPTPVPEEEELVQEEEEEEEESSGSSGSQEDDSGSEDEEPVENPPASENDTDDDGNDGNLPNPIFGSDADTEFNDTPPSPQPEVQPITIQICQPLCGNETEETIIMPPTPEPTDNCTPLETMRPPNYEEVCGDIGFFG